MALLADSSKSSGARKPLGTTEFEILKASHKFLRDGEERGSSWDEQLAAKYYSSLYREFALCDLKHFKSGNFAMRWRTEEEVLGGFGESTCGNTRCEYHRMAREITLTTMELPFAYVEHGENKSALVKVVLCGSCVRKLMWKRRKERERSKECGDEGQRKEERGARDEGRENRGEDRSRRKDPTVKDRTCKRNSRSRSPRR